MLFSRIVIKRRKNTIVLGGTFFGPFQDAQSVCAVAKKGTVLKNWWFCSVTVWLRLGARMTTAHFGELYD